VKRYRDPSGKIWVVGDGEPKASPPGNPGQPSIFAGWPFFLLCVALVLDLETRRR
jgi:hypothetical protein